MIFYINNENGTGYSYPTKELFLKNISDIIDYLVDEGATYFDVAFESDPVKKGKV